MVSCMLNGYKKAYDKIIEVGRDDVNKFSGYKADDVLLPYKQVEFLTTQGLTKELNKLAGIRPGSRHRETEECTAIHPRR